MKKHKNKYERANLEDRLKELAVMALGDEEGVIIEGKNFRVSYSPLERCSILFSARRNSAVVLREMKYSLETNQVTYFLLGNGRNYSGDRGMSELIGIIGGDEYSEINALLVRLNKYGSGNV